LPAVLSVVGLVLAATAAADRSGYVVATDFVAADGRADVARLSSDKIHEAYLR